MKFNTLFLIIFSLFITSCNSSKNNKKRSILKEIVIDSTLVIHKDSLFLNGNEGKWYFKKKLFNGFAIKYYGNNSLKEKTGFVNGKKQGVYKVWFKNGALKLASHYNKNTLEGSYKTWWINGNLSSDVNFVKGKKEGIEKQYYSDGSLSKERNFLKGSENGLQRAWLQNGKIYVNYEAKNGRTFGLQRAKLCYQLKDENVEEYKKK
jgi:antitoxin component YwqK of YwqJK toxin-antitoxin module